jgi:hypothetical protein
MLQLKCNVNQEEVGNMKKVHKRYLLINILILGTPLPGKWDNMRTPKINLEPRIETRDCPFEPNDEDVDNHFLSQKRGLSLLNLLRQRNPQRAGQPIGRYDAADVQKRALTTFRMRRDPEKRALTTFRMRRDPEKRALTTVRMRRDPEKRALTTFRMRRDPEKRDGQPMNAARKRTSQAKKRTGQPINEMRRRRSETKKRAGQPMNEMKRRRKSDGNGGDKRAGQPMNEMKRRSKSEPDRKKRAGQPMNEMKRRRKSEVAKKRDGQPTNEVRRSQLQIISDTKKRAGHLDATDDVTIDRLKKTDEMVQSTFDDDYDEDEDLTKYWTEYDTFGYDKRKKRGLGSMFKRSSNNNIRW